MLSLSEYHEALSLLYFLAQRTFSPENSLFKPFAWVVDRGIDEEMLGLLFPSCQGRGQALCCGRKMLALAPDLKK